MAARPGRRGVCGGHRPALSQPLSSRSWGGSAWLRSPPTPKASPRPLVRSSPAPGWGLREPLGAGQGGLRAAPSLRGSPGSGTAAMAGGRAAGAPRGRGPAQHGAVEPGAPQHWPSCGRYPPARQDAPPGLEQQRESRCALGTRWKTQVTQPVNWLTLMMKPWGGRGGGSQAHGCSPAASPWPHPEPQKSGVPLGVGPSDRPLPAVPAAAGPGDGYL